MSGEDKINRKHFSDEVETSVSSRNIAHLFQYFTQTDPNVLTDPEQLRKQFGIALEELEEIPEEQ